MRTGMLLAFLALCAFSAISARADDPPDYRRALVGRVAKVVGDCVVIQSLSQDKALPGEPPPGVDHMCFVFGTVYVRGLRGKFHVGEHMEITVAETKDTITDGNVAEIRVYKLMSEFLDFPVHAQWDEGGGGGGGSLDDPIGGVHH